MMVQSATLMRCTRCKAVISTAEATRLIRHGVPCGVCGGTLSLCGGEGRTRSSPDRGGDGGPRPSAERRLLAVLRKAGGRPVEPLVLAQAGIYDPANAIFELERAGYRIERVFAEVSSGQRRFLGYRFAT